MRWTQCIRFCSSYNSLMHALGCCINLLSGKGHVVDGVRPEIGPLGG